MDEKYDINDININISRNENNSPQQTSIETIYKKNKDKNTSKINIFSFLSNMTRIEISITTLQSNFYWISISEFLLWIILFILFCFSPKDMKKIWLFIFHVPRGIIGIFILQFIPRTYEVIQHINNFEENSLIEIEKYLKKEFVSLLNKNEKTSKTISICYFTLSILCLIIDVILFFIITPDFGKSGIEIKFFVLIIGDICFIFCECAYFIYYGSFSYMFPKQTTQAIKQALCGFFTQLKVGIANGFSNLDKKFSKNKNNQNESANNAKRNDNEGGNDNERGINNEKAINNNNRNEINNVAINK